MILSIILALDKTHLTNYTGNKSMHAVYMSLGNIHKDIWRTLSAHAWLLLAKIPVTKFLHTTFQGSQTEQKAMPGILRQCLFHTCMKIILTPTRLDAHKYHAVPGPDGLLQLTMVVMMAWIADMEEQWLISGVQKNHCPVCMVSHQDLDCWHNAVSHTACLAEAMLKHMSSGKKLGNVEVAYQVQLRNFAGKAFQLAQCRWENWSFWGGTTLHNSQGAEYVDGKGTSLMNLGGDEG